MNFFKRNLEDTIHAIKDLVKTNRRITVQNIRLFHEIKSSNRSKINFIWRSLEYLAEQKCLKCIDRNSPKIYELTPQGKEDIYKFDLKIRQI